MATYSIATEQRKVAIRLVGSSEQTPRMAAQTHGWDTGRYIRGSALPSVGPVRLCAARSWTK